MHLRPQVMQIALLLLLLAPLAGLAAPIEKPSSPYHLVNGNAEASDFSPTCYRRWRHHGHLTFRLARVQSCSGRSHRQDSSTNTNGYPESIHNKRAVPWVG